MRQKVGYPGRTNNELVLTSLVSIRGLSSTNIFKTCFLPL